MAEKINPETSTAKSAPQYAKAGVTNADVEKMLGMSTAWMGALSDMGAEVMSFVAERIKEDVKTQHKVLHCKDVTELQQVQAEFIQRAMEQYQDETGKLVDLSTKVFTPESKGNGNKD